jgi:hypothetical protein
MSRPDGPENATGRAGQQAAGGGPKGGASWRALGAAVALSAALVVIAFLLWPKEKPAEAGRLVARFVALHNEKDPAAAGLLGPPVTTSGRWLGEGEAEAYQADFCLRSALKVVGVYPGDPDGSGRQRGVAGHYTLATSGSVGTAEMRTRLASGREWVGSYVLTNPDVIVEVRGGKIYGLRTALPVR